MVKTKIKIIVIGFISLFLLAIVLVIYNRVGKKPYAKISREDITEISVGYMGLEPYKLTDQETDQFLKLLREIIVYQRDDTYVEYDGFGDSWVYVKKKNGKELYLRPGNPFFVINKKGYRTEYKPCDRLSMFLVKIIEEKVRVY